MLLKTKHEEKLSMEQIKKALTKQLVEELESREGVESVFVPPDEQLDLHIDGFATVLIVRD